MQKVDHVYASEDMLCVQRREQPVYRNGNVFAGRPGVELFAERFEKSAHALDLEIGKEWRQG